MAIFGKKKQDKEKSSNNPPTSESVSSISPSLEGAPRMAPPGSSMSKEGSSSSGAHAGKGSLSGSMGPGGAGVGSGFGALNGQSHGSSIPSGIGMSPGGSMNGPPGAASGFKFGGPPSSRPEGGVSGIPVPGQGRLRKMSEDSSGSHAGYGTSNKGSIGPVGMMGAPSNTSTSGLPASSSGPGSGLPIYGGPGGQMGPGAAPGQTQGPEKARSQVVYPWSQRSLVMNPPRFLDETRQAPPGALSPYPFPRYGHAANQAASPNGEIYLFGGLVRESVKNDLYTIYVDKLANPASAASPPAAGPNSNGIYATATLVQTTGEIPPPRVGHATVLVSNVLILWGGDTKVRADDKQDEGLYLLNLSTREWTRVRNGSDDPNSGPVGRYGHTVSIVGSRFYVFGGQVDGNFMNDLWSFDLNSLKGTPTWECVKPASELPPRRTGHASVTYKDKIYVFGGTDGQYHYNDTWCYDVATNTWKELSCIGFIPVPREGHATCLVDDVMYIFGGRGVDGKDLGDLASFKISNQRWYMFANMGPVPSGRSGHALANFHNKVVVLGGESFTGAKPDDPAMIHVLDTGKIKYPSDNPQQKGSQLRKSNMPGGPMPAGGQGNAQQPPQPGSQIRGMPSVAEEDARRAASPTQKGQRAPNGLMSMSQPESPDGPGGAKAMRPSQPAPPLQLQQQQGRSQGRPDGSDDRFDGPARSMSPTAQTVREQRAAALGGSQQPPSISSVQAQQRAMSPPGTGQHQSLMQQQPQQQPAPYNGPRSQRSLENLRGPGAGAASPTMMTGMTRSMNGVLDRPSNQGAPQDAFHYGRGSTPPGAQMNGYGTNKTVSNELEAMRRRENWLKAALAVAAKKGFVAPEQIQMPDGSILDERVASPDRVSLDSIDIGGEGSDKERVVRALVSLKTQLANAKATIAQQAQGEAERSAEAERARAAALQEAAYYRAKMAALEAGNTADVSKLDRDRAAQFEKSLSEALRESAQLERQVSTLREQVKLEQQLRASAEERLTETAKRAMAAEAAQMKAYDELSALQKRTYATESSLRDHSEQVVTLSSLVTRHKADHSYTQGQLEEANASIAQHVSALAQLQAAHSAISSRAAEQERLYDEHRNLAQQHQATISQLRVQLDTRTREAESLAARVTELDALLERHRQEAESHRSAATGSLATLLSQRDAQTSRDLASSVPSHLQEKMQALEEETESLRQLQSQHRQLADASSAQLQEMREKNLALEKQHSGLRSELGAVRSQLAVSLQEIARIKDVTTGKDLELRDRTRLAEAAQVKASLLKQFIADRGIAIPNDDEISVKSGYADKRIHELEEELDARTREAQEAEHRLQDSESRVEELTRELEHASSRASRGAEGDGQYLAEAQQRAEAAERELAESNASYKERLAQLENDYQTAVQFVKGTEKMLRKMKDELTKHKTANASLQAEVATLRSGSLPEDGPGAEEAARDIEALRNRLVDVTQQSEEVASENRELEKKLAAALAGQQASQDRAKEGESSSADSSRKVIELESQIQRLESSLNDAKRELQNTHELNNHLSSELASATKLNGGAPSVDRDNALAAAESSNEVLKRDNADLTRRLHEAEDKFQLLLGRIESTHEGGDERARDSMAYGSITSELDKWERDRSLAEHDNFGLGSNGAGDT
ncbi:hypothetical protein IE53DRAFT_301311, partial [Violaceomyces palustris]